MTIRAEFTYMQARCQACYSMQLRTEWQRLAGTRDPGAFLATLLRRPPHASLTSLSARMGVHEFEGLLRKTYRRIVHEVAAWMPSNWRPAVNCVAVLADLPAIQFLLKTGDAYAWLQSDDSLNIYTQGASRKAAGAQAAHGFLNYLRREPRADSLVNVWTRYWHTLWPPMTGAQRAQLLELETAVLRSRQRLADIKTQSSRAEIETLERKFIRSFRQRIQTPAAAFAYLGLSWLELARIRAGLLERRLIAPPS
jgi:hypothetical protein